MARVKAPRDPELEAGIETALELFAPLGPITARRMFGGAGIHLDGRMFALVAGSDIYLKADALNLARFVEASCPPFVFEGKSGKVSTMSYRRLPDAALDDLDQAVAWGRLGVEAAMRARP